MDQINTTVSLTEQCHKLHCYTSSAFIQCRFTARRPQHTTHYTCTCTRTWI